MIRSPLTADPRALAALKAQTRHGPGSAETQRAVARQFESIFAQMMIHSMRATHFGDDGLGNAGRLYTSLFDRQIAQAMTQGRGLGLARMLMRQMQGPASPDATFKEGTTPTAAGAASLAPTQSATALRPLAAADHVVGVARAQGGAAAPAAASATGDDSSLPDKIRHFVDRLLPQARAVAEKLGVSTRAIIAQAALETGWGQHGVGSADGGDAHNLFGIKATGDAPATTATTTEYIDGTAHQITARFRRYDSDPDAFDSYAALIGGNPRYSAVVGSGDDIHRFATALQRAGYATDPNYAQKLISIADNPVLNAAIDAATRTTRS